MSDVSRVDDTLRNPERVRRLMKSLGQKLIDAAADTLKALSDKLDMTKTRTPSFRMVLVSDGDFAYRRKDGVIVCPIGCLRP